MTKNLVSPTLKDFGTADIWRCAKAAGVTLMDTFSPQGGPSFTFFLVPRLCLLSHNRSIA